MSTRLGVAVSAALEAGELLLGHRRRGVETEHKGPIDVVSVADRQAEALVCGRIAAAFPDDQIVGEEGDDIPEAVVRGRSRWYVDPLDGTTNFLQGSPRFGVSIAWCSPDDHVEVGVVYAPATDELFTAEAGGGSRLNGDPLRVSDVRLEDAVIGSGFPYDFDGPTNLPEWGAVVQQARSLRCQGAAALGLCDVGRGHLSGFWERRLERWDTAAGGLVAAEAGARVTDLDGGSGRGPLTDIVAAAPTLHGPLLRLLRSVR